MSTTPWVRETWADDVPGTLPKHYERGWGGTNLTLLTDYARRAPGRYRVWGDENPSDPSYTPLKPGVRSYSMGASAAMPTGGGNSGVWYARKHLGLPDPDEMWWGYAFMFSDKFNPAPQGGKMPGWDSRYSRGQYKRPVELFDQYDPPFAGNGGVQSNGSNGWTVRGGYRSVYARPYDSAPGTPEGFAPLQTDPAWLRGERRPFAYCYIWSLQEHVSYTGIGLPFSLPALKTKWYYLRSYVKLNTATPEHPDGLFDGIIRYWLTPREGNRWGATTLICERTNLRFRKYLAPPMRQIGINGFWLTFQHGGVPNWTAEDTFCYVGEVAIGPGDPGLPFAAEEARGLTASEREQALSGLANTDAVLATARLDAEHRDPIFADTASARSMIEALPSRLG